MLRLVKNKNIKLLRIVLREAELQRRWFKWHYGWMFQLLADIRKLGW